MNHSDPFAIFPRYPDGSFREGIYHRIQHHLMPDAVKLGWIPVPPWELGFHGDEYVAWATWIECACGRAMPVPR
jgi:hypothetical protein